MIRKLLSIVFLATLAGCGSEEPAPKATPTASATPLAWLPAEPVCKGAITRPEWLLCEDKMLGDLHRRLAAQGEKARENAPPDRLKVLQNQFQALVIERGACRDAACIATAYRRYLEGPDPAPTVRPRPEPVARPKPKPRPTATPSQTPSPRARYQPPPSCIAQIGNAQAQYLTRQCQIVNEERGGRCDAEQSCEALRGEIRRGCASSDRAPGFCFR